MSCRMSLNWIFSDIFLLISLELFYFGEEGHTDKVRFLIPLYQDCIPLR